RHGHGLRLGLRRRAGGREGRRPRPRGQRAGEHGRRLGLPALRRGPPGRGVDVHRLSGDLVRPQARHRADRHRRHPGPGPRPLRPRSAGAGAAAFAGRPARAAAPRPARRPGRLSVPPGRPAAMSYGLAVWEGGGPEDDAAAARIFEDLYDRCMEAESGRPPTERIAAYVAALLEWWCDATEDEDDSSPWASGPLIGEAGGPL